tara:strand:- start:68 stop:559 length:492 start_codon:yes stop_codon:yes gene_type:complete
MNIKINENHLLYKGYKLKCCVGKSGIKKVKKEGDLATPKGTFKLGLLYYRRDRIKLPKCKVKKKIIKKNMGWCNDSRSNKYNRQINFPYNYSSEKLYKKENVYDLFLLIKYNTTPVIKKKGSAIFLHIAKKNYQPTQGCIAISKKNFIKILPLINRKTKITII